MKFPSSFVGALAAAAMTLSSTAAMAQQASSQPCQGSGCVLPLPAPAVAAPVVDSVPAPIETAAVGETKSFGLLPLLLGALAIGLAAFLLLNEDDEEPVSP